MTGFFELLPSDIHLSVIQSWLDGPGDKERLLALSALDIACSRQHRPLLLSLLCHPCISWSSKYDQVTMVVPRALACYLIWLELRQVAVRVVVVMASSDVVCPASGAPDTESALMGPLTLPYVETIIIEQCNAPALLEGVLRACPKLSHVITKHTVSTDFWETLSVIAHLNSISVSTTADTNAMCRVLEVVGPKLMELCVGSKAPIEFFTLLQQHCNQLVTLECNISSLPVSILTIVLAVCPIAELQVSVLELQDTSPADILALLHSAKCLRRFKLDFTIYSSSDVTYLSLFCSILQTFPQIECLEFPLNIKYDRCTHTLALYSGRIVPSDLEWLHVLCPDVRIAWVSGEMDEQALVRVGQLWGQGVTDLTVQVNGGSVYSALDKLLALCPRVTHLHVFGQVIGRTLQQIASHCPDLVNLTLTAWSRSNINDQGMLAVLAACPRLKEIRLSGALGLSVAVLEDIVTRRLPVTKFFWDASSSLTDMNIRWFRNFSKKKQLLPVAKLGKEFV